MIPEGKSEMWERIVRKEESKFMNFFKHANWKSTMLHNEIRTKAIL